MIAPASQLYAVFATGFTTRFAVESALGLEAGSLDRYMAGEDRLTEEQEIQLIELLAEYERRIRQANAAAAYQHISRLIDQA
ncbi:MAG: hypothetical protein WEA80_01950 [Gemmatimonadaceae bacterium]